MRGEAAPLPGEELVEQGLRDLARGVESVEALLVSIGAPRLRGLGLEIAAPFRTPEDRLYDLLAAEDPDAAHGRYNALFRRLVSFERAAECARSGASSAGERASTVSLRSSRVRFRRRVEAALRSG